MMTAQYRASSIFGRSSSINYEEKIVQILEVTQATIQRGLKIKIDNRSGKATGNNFTINKSGKALLTEYDIDVAEASPLAFEIEAEYNEVV